MVYIAFRFDFRYGPGTVVALLHDAILVIGAFAVTYKEFSLTTVAAILTIIGFSMNDTIVVFDRIRENAARLRDRRFDRVVNQSINETLSRTILTSATVFFVTLAMNVFGVGVIRDFAFAMNVGVIVGTYSSIFIASPILIWLNDKYSASQRKQQAARRRRPRRAARRDEEPEERLAAPRAKNKLSTGGGDTVAVSMTSASPGRRPRLTSRRWRALAAAMGIRPLTARLLVARGIGGGGAGGALPGAAPRGSAAARRDGRSRSARSTGWWRRWPRARRSASSATTTSTASRPRRS